MKNISYIAFIFAVMFSFGCATTQETPQKSVFSFTYNEQRFEIVSLNTSSGEGTNIISELSADDDKSIARDINQDGTVDIVIRGKFTLEEFDAIYKAGIKAAQQSGNYKERASLRRFEWNREQYTLVITTYYVDSDELNNVFFVLFKADQSEHLYSDLFSNGTLDNQEKGLINIERAQQLYEMTLLKGMDDDRIVFEDGRYIVAPKRSYLNRRTSTALSSID